MVLPQLPWKKPVHTYAAAGNYTVTATITRQGETTQISRDITIAVVPVANTAPTITECDPDNNNITTFTLNDNNAAILGTQSSTQFEVKYYATQENADNNTAPLSGTAYTNTANPETIYARIYNKSNNRCYATTSFEIKVANTPVMLGNSFSICDDALDGNDTNGLATFDLGAVTQAIVQNTTDFSTSYYATEADAQSELNPLPVSFTNTVPNEQVVYARVVNNAAPVCFLITPVTLTVNPLPANITDALLVQCDTGTAADGITQFNLLQANNLITGGIVDREVEYFLNATEAATGTPLPSFYTNISNPQLIVAKVTNTQTGCVRLINLRLQVNTANTTPISLELCDDDGTEDGLRLFDLTEAGLEGTADSVIYYAFLHDALQEQNPISTDYTNSMVSLQSVYARLENTNNCVALQEIKLIVRPLPNIVTEDEAIVCVNTGEFIELDSGVSGNAAGYEFLWSTGATTRRISVNQPGVYTVNVINANNISRCERLRTITVNPSNVAIIDHIEVIDLVDNNTVTVYVSPTGNVNTTYLYSLDAPNGPFQESNHFEYVTAGIHTVYVSDVNGCGVVSKEIAVLQIPKFFTPNGDGINDTWDIVGMNSEFYKNSEIIIFDRFGKMLSNVDPKGRGWNGLYNGHPLPATDYWYVVTLDNGRTVKGHFSMIR
jgi:gliding motility-associated-like protein